MRFNGTTSKVSVDRKEKQSKDRDVGFSSIKREGDEEDGGGQKRRPRKSSRRGRKKTRRMESPRGR